MVQPDLSSSQLPGYFQHICCQGLVSFFEIFIYTSLLFLDEEEKSLPSKVGAGLPGDTALVTKSTSLC
jgi:hypothetical protein